MADDKVPESQQRAENAVLQMVTATSSKLLDALPMGIAAPLREAARTCQLAPPGNWPVSAYRAIGRNDLAACGSDEHDMLFNDGYRPVKDFIVSEIYYKTNFVLRIIFRTHLIHVRLLVKLLRQLDLQAMAMSMPFLVLSWTFKTSLIFDLVKTEDWRKWLGSCALPRYRQSKVQIGLS